MTPVFHLREIASSDLTELVKYANNKRIAQYMTDRFPYPYTQDAGRNFISFAKAQNNSFIKAIDVSGKLVGAIGLHQQEDVMKHNAELGYWIAEEYWNQGITTLAVKQMVDWGFDNLDIVRIYARPYGSNKASQRILEKLNFTFETRIESNIKKWDKWEDELVYSIRRT